jgi:uncharacterized protein (DUF58 family)
MSAIPGWTRGVQAAVDRLSIAAPYPARSQLAGSVVSRSLGRALEFADYRAYAPGDDPKLVDWRAYNRLDRLYLKQFREERSRTITLLVDGSASLDFGEGDLHKGLYARRLAAALAWIGLGRMERVCCFVLRGESAVAVPTPTSRSTALGLFRALEEVSEAGPVALGPAVANALRQVRGASGPAFLLSDLLDSDWPAVVRLLAAREQGDVLLQVLAPEEWEPPLGDEVELQDSETGEVRQTRFGPHELSEYRERLAAFLEDIGAECRRYGMRHVPLNTATPLADTLLRTLPRAGVLA